MNTAYQEHMAAAMAAALAAKGSLPPDTAEMRLYLDKLKDLVPLCPKNRSVTKLELIQHVIDYISDLQDTLQSDSEPESPPESPLEHASFSDAYTNVCSSRSSQLPDYSKQQSGQGMQISDGFPMEYSSDYSNNFNGATGYSSSSFNSTSAPGCSAAGNSKIDSSSSSSDLGSVSGYSDTTNYSTILYSDHGNSSGPRHRPSC
ncbi:DNA-binding protein inhibitor ID-2-B-like [Homarus americanus]|uniref:Extra-macrochaetae-like 1 n=1 Tax=Homarus americanus TaxID=6706 RepID=A0A8J5JHW9_HOMAM|nr:DNA-binding protein inhibitor ID-2-B-like [Homarus americanus]KAG7158642.1 extra-macrochaetae-like 1 [Homarus americanus]